MIKKILIGLVLVIAAILLVAAFQPNHYAITRSITIPAAPAAVFARVNDLHQWQAWSPWEKLDPAMKRSFEGPGAGVGAAYSWDGNNDVGAGRMTITSIKPAEEVRLKLHFLKPFEDESDTVFTFKPEGSQTVVTWTMSGQNKYLSKVICLFMNMDKMVGGQFEEGLNNLKKISSVPAAP